MLEQFEKDIITAMKEKNQETLSVLRMVKAAMNQERIDHKKEVNDELLIDVIAKEIKTRNDSIKEFEKGNRMDLVNQTQNEITILGKYLPAQLTDDELDKIIDEVFQNLNPTSMKDMGRVMAELTPKVKGKAEMGKVSSKVKNRLS